MRLSEAKQQREEFEARMRENTLELERLRGQLSGTTNDDELTPRSSSNTRRKLQSLKEERDRLEKEGRTLDNKVARLQAERQKVRASSLSKLSDEAGVFEMSPSSSSSSSTGTMAISPTNIYRCMSTFCLTLVPFCHQVYDSWNSDVRKRENLLKLFQLQAKKASACACIACYV